MLTHRSLMLSAKKRYRLWFLRLPHDLQDDIMDRLDSTEISLYQASALAKAQGYPISHAAIAKYCKAVRKERRMLLLSEIKRGDRNE